MAQHAPRSNPRWVDPETVVAAARERALQRAGPEVRSTLEAVYARDAGQPFQRYGHASEFNELLLANARNRQLARLGGDGTQWTAASGVTRSSPIASTCSSAARGAQSKQGRGARSASRHYSCGRCARR